MKVDLSKLSLTIATDTREFNVKRVNVPAKVDIKFKSPFAAGAAYIAALARMGISVGHARIELDETAVAAIQETIVAAYARKISAVDAADLLEGMLNANTD